MLHHQGQTGVHTSLKTHTSSKPHTQTSRAEGACTSKVTHLAIQGQEHEHSRAHSHFPAPCPAPAARPRVWGQKVPLSDRGRGRGPDRKGPSWAPNLPRGVSAARSLRTPALSRRAATPALLTQFAPRCPSVLSAVTVREKPDPQKPLTRPLPQSPRQPHNSTHLTRLCGAPRGSPTQPRPAAHSRGEGRKLRAGRACPATRLGFRALQVRTRGGPRRLEPGSSRPAPAAAEFVQKLRACVCARAAQCAGALRPCPDAPCSLLPARRPSPAGYLVLVPVRPSRGPAARCTAADLAVLALAGDVCRAAGASATSDSGTPCAPAPGSVG